MTLTASPVKFPSKTQRLRHAIADARTDYAHALRDLKLDALLFGIELQRKAIELALARAASRGYAYENARVLFTWSLGYGALNPAKGGHTCRSK